MSGKIMYNKTFKFLSKKMEREKKEKMMKKSHQAKELNSKLTKYYISIKFFLILIYIILFFLEVK